MGCTTSRTTAIETSNGHGVKALAPHPSREATNVSQRVHRQTPQPAEQNGASGDGELSGNTTEASPAAAAEADVPEASTPKYEEVEEAAAAAQPHVEVSPPESASAPEQPDVIPDVIPPKVEVDEAGAAESTEWSEFEISSLCAHNNYRNLHGVSELELNRDLCSMAQEWADHLAAEGLFEHADSSITQYKDSSTGENISARGSSAEVDDVNFLSGDDATKMWYDEINDYDYSNPGFSMNTGHFTQVVWKSSKQLGVGRALSPDRKTVTVVARYYPSGNFQDQFEENVTPLS